MSPARIVEALDEFEDGHARFGLRLEATPIEQLTFERGEETLRHRVVVGVSDRPHRGANACLSTSFAELDRGILGGFKRSSQHGFCGAHSVRIWQSAAGIVEGAFFERAPSPEQKRGDLTWAEILDGLRAARAHMGSVPKSITDRLVYGMAGLVFDKSVNSPAWFARARVDREDALALADAVAPSKRAANRMIDHAAYVAAGIVDRNREQIEALGDELARRGEMNGTEIRAALARSGFPAPVVAGRPPPPLAMRAVAE